MYSCFGSPHKEDYEPEPERTTEPTTVDWQNATLVAREARLDEIACCCVGTPPEPCDDCSCAWDYSLIAQVDSLITERDAALKALRENLPNCGSSAGDHEDCASIGVWEYHDPDGQEWKCDEHKALHFYVDGPLLDKTKAKARALLDHYSLEKTNA